MLLSILNKRFVFPALGAILLFLAPSVRADFVVVDNFDALTPGGIDGQNGWSARDSGGAVTSNIAVTADPIDAGNQVLSFVTESVRGYKAINIANGTTGTLFFRMYRNGTTNFSLGGSDIAAPTNNFGDYEVQLNVQQGGSSTPVDQLNVRSAGNFLAVDTWAADTWYDVWVVANNSTDRFEAYMQGGALTTRTKLDTDTAQTLFTFRNSGTAVQTNDLVSFLARTGSGHTGTSYLDDIQLDTSGRNLINPLVTPISNGLIDDFESCLIGPIDGQNEWVANSTSVEVVADPADSANQVLALSGVEYYGYKQMSIPDDSVGTLFFRMYRNGVINGSGGASDSVDPTVWGDYEAQMNLQQGSPDVLNVRDGANFIAVDTFAEDTWYNIWLVIDNPNDEYKVYMQGGGLTEQTLLDDATARTIFGFRNGADSRDLMHFFARVGNGNAGTLYFDDVYVFEGENLSNPVPEPSTWCLLLLALTLLAPGWRKWRNRS